MDIDEARERALARLREMESPESPLSLHDDIPPREQSWCWMFYFNSDRYLETHESRYNVVTGPLVVNKDGSDVWVAPSSPPLEHWLDVYAQNHGYPGVEVTNRAGGSQAITVPQSTVVPSAQVS